MCKRFVDYSENGKSSRSPGLTCVEVSLTILKMENRYTDKGTHTQSSYGVRPRIKRVDAEKQ